ncbi:hypothetical protein HYPBUDRAFT_148783 [Hyphopichia burtonii NRRL Y-1933]|uniref:AN1-type domain-containing protein n=1 Tax=Hyphopichia burtonii NRRL Y-1933 TaxID=984485 RepID=A0A1E4RIT8_9ASCO|nr:hypothetical protein HYPBUDRAFT_148783 [Hyphopichia burtonii NRRL Y-1933]ODV67015.1 hypothetical protein HYPBUDRAFT_148783 [Hyphopichia burtonii NRRL Y-1933]
MTSADLFAREKSPEKELGLMNLGEHCFKCQQLDFLPFKCEYCQHTYCSQHRNLDSHECRGKAKFERGRSPGNYNDGRPSAQSLFPDRNEDKAKINEMIANTKRKPTNIIERQLGTVKGPDAFNKFKKFLSLQKDKQPRGTIGKLFQSKLKSTNKIVELSKIKKTAIGDPKINESDRIYMWCLYIDGNEEELSKINVENDRKPIFILNKWPVGRALDSITDHLKIKNYNNSTLESSERLNIFMSENGPQDCKLVENNHRTINSFKNGDLIYLVKGSLK